MYSRLIRPPNDQSFFLFGPRGTGKSSWVRQRFPKATYIDLLNDETYRERLVRPSSLETRLPRGGGEWIIIDEVQKILELLDEVHRQIELKKHKFILNGSSARKLRRQGVNLLAGRALNRSIYPLTAAEMGSDFRVEERIRWRSLSAITQFAEKKDFLNAYVRTYLKEEVQQEGLVRNLAAFGRFLEAASFSQAQILNMTSVARECAVERKVVEEYFQILEDLLIAARLPVFQRRAKRKMTSHPKFFYFDAGVYRLFRPQGPLDRAEGVDEIALETLVFHELRAMNEYLKLDYELFTWRTALKAEVDLVLYGPGGIHAIEVKRTARIRPEDLKGLELFTEDYPMARGWFVYQGEESRHFWENYGYSGGRVPRLAGQGARFEGVLANPGQSRFYRICPAQSSLRNSRTG